jgi:hypothetical protein
LLTECAAHDSSPAGASAEDLTSSFTLLVSGSPSRTSARPLTGAALTAKAYVFTSDATGSTAPAGVQQVAYWLDNPAMSGAPTHVEHFVPYDFAGTASDGTGDAWDTTKIASGSHTLTQAVTLTSGAIQGYTATFGVGSSLDAGVDSGWDAGTSHDAAPDSPSGLRHYYVSTTGSDANSGTDSAHPWQTLQHANETFTLGASGTIVHVAPGSYGRISTCNGFSNSNLCVSRGGTATQRVVWKCDDPSTGCLLLGAGAPGGSGNGISIIVSGINAHHVDIEGFDATAPAGGEGVILYCGTYGGIDTNLTGCSSIHILHNRFHDYGVNACNSSGIISSIIRDPAGTSAQMPVKDLQIIGNRIDHVGAPAGAPNGCNQYHGIYPGGGNAPGDLVIQNNVISNVVGWGIHLYHNPCNAIITNNLLVHNGKGAMILEGFHDGPSCTNGFGHIVVANNIMEDNCIPSQRPCSNGAGPISLFPDSPGTTVTATYLENNLFFGNQPSDAIQLNGTSGVTVDGNITGESLTTTFVRFSDSPASADYHLRAGSRAIGGGTTNCHGVSSVSCTPSEDIDGTARPNPPSVGPYEP